MSRSNEIIAKWKQVNPDALLKGKSKGTPKASGKYGITYVSRDREEDDVSAPVRKIERKHPGFFHFESEYGTNDSIFTIITHYDDEEIHGIHADIMVVAEPYIMVDGMIWFDSIGELKEIIKWGVNRAQQDSEDEDRDRVDLERAGQKGRAAYNKFNKILFDGWDKSKSGHTFAISSGAPNRGEWSFNSLCNWLALRDLGLRK